MVIVYEIKTISQLLQFTYYIRIYILYEFKFKWMVIMFEIKTNSQRFISKKYLVMNSLYLVEIVVRYSVEPSIT